MSGLGFWELILLFVIGLIVLGPERLPRVASQLGSWLGQARRMTRVMKRQLEEELDLEKNLNIRRPPAAKALPQQPAGTSSRADDDTRSPAHDAISSGTGAGTGSDPGEDTFSDTDVLPEPEPGSAERPRQPEGDPGATGTDDKT